MNVDTNTIAHMLNVSVKTVHRYQSRDDDPLPRVCKGGKGQGDKAFYDLQAVHQWAMRQQTGGLDVNRERALNLRADTALKEIRAQELSRELVHVDVLKYVLQKIAAQLNSIFQTIPSNIKRRLPSIDAVAMDIIKREVIKAQNIASKPDMSFLDELVDNSGK